jgi:uncharacterized repeat protein (TIGR01451 family)
MKLLRIFLSVIVACLLLVVVFAWVNHTALASAPPSAKMKVSDSWNATNSVLPKSSNVLTNVLPSGDSYIHGLIYDNGYLYASTRTCVDVQTCTDPARVLKIDPNTLTVVSTATLTALYGGEDIVAANGYIWVILYMTTARLVRLDPATLTGISVMEFNKSITQTMGEGESLDYAFGYLWAGGRDHLARVDISNPITPTYQLYDLSFLNLPGSDGGLLGSLSNDNQFLWGTYKQYSNTLESFYASTVIKMDPANPAGAYEKAEIATDTPDDSANTGGAYFVGSEGYPSNIYKFSSNPSVYTATKASDNASYGLFLNPSDPLSIWGTYVGSPGSVKIFNLDETLLFKVTLPSGINDPGEIAFDSSGNVFITTWQNPSKIVKLSPPYLPADLSIGVNATPDPVFAGDDITYTLAITNNGPLDAIGVHITDTLPSQVSFISSTPASPECSINNMMLTCVLGDLSAHTSQQVIVSAHVNDLASGLIKNSATVTSSTYDSDLQDNTATRQATVVNSADLKIQNSADNPRVALGDMLVYSINVSNIGPTRAFSVTVQDVLPAGVDYLSSAPGAIQCTDHIGTITCDIGRLDANQGALIQLNVRVNKNATDNLHNSVGISSSTSDPVASNNSASLDTSVYHRLFLPVTR